MSTIDIINKVSTRNDFVSYVSELSKDCRENPEAWQNSNLATYLEALAAWVEDMDGFYLNQGLPVPEKPDWKTVAEMLTAAKCYE